MSLLDLNEESTYEYLQYLTPEDIKALCATNKTFRDSLCENPNGILWEKLLQRKYPEYVYEFPELTRKDAWNHVNNEIARFKTMVSTLQTINAGIGIGITLFNLKLNDSVFTNTNFRNAQFMNCILIKCQFHNCNLNGVNIIDSDIIDNIFQNSTLIQTVFNDSNIRNTNIQQCDLSYVRARRLSMDTVNIIDSNLVYGTYIKVDWNNCRINDIDLSNCHFRHADLTTCIIQNSRFLHTKWIESIINNSRILDCDFSDADIDIEFKVTELYHMLYLGTYYTYISFNGYINEYIKLNL